MKMQVVALPPGRDGFLRISGSAVTCGPRRKGTRIRIALFFRGATRTGRVMEDGIEQLASFMTWLANAAAVGLEEQR